MISSEQLSLELHQVEREIGKRTRELSMVSAAGLGGREVEQRVMQMAAALPPWQKALCWMAIGGVPHLPHHFSPLQNF